MGRPSSLSPIPLLRNRSRSVESPNADPPFGFRSSTRRGPRTPNPHLNPVPPRQTRTLRLGAMRQGIVRALARDL